MARTKPNATASPLPVVLQAPNKMRILTAAVALALLAFCGFGFLASFESPDFMGWRIGYGVAGAACLAAITWTLTSSKPSV